MLESLSPQPADSILRLMQIYREDPRAAKIDLGVGVYRDAAGLTPIMRAVKSAEKRLLDTEVTKTYTALAGEAAFNVAAAKMILGDVVPMERIASAASVGGTGAIRQALELIKLANPDAAVWVSDPTWPNHLSIITYLGIPSRTYRYFDAETRGIDFAGLIADLGAVKPGDIVLLHGCCHNPTGADLNAVQWRQVVDQLAERGAVPFVDLAYQGFGDGLEQDAGPTRMIAARFPQVLIAASCSKNFGIYRERTGILIIICGADQRATVQANLAQLNRVNFSFPPDHGARIVTTILQDAGLTAVWKAELEEVRLSLLSLRQALAEALCKATGSDRYGFVAQHRGMFSRIGLTADQVERLRVEHGIYMVSDSRINIAGLNAGTVPILAAAIASVAA